MSVPRERVVELMKAQCKLFATTFNPKGLRMGNRILRQNLRGPAVASYYPRKVATINDVIVEFGPDLTTWDEDEVNRLTYIEELKARGKSNPKKKSGPPSAYYGKGKKK